MVLRLRLYVGFLRQWISEKFLGIWLRHEATGHKQGSILKGLVQTSWLWEVDKGRRVELGGPLLVEISHTLLMTSALPHLGGHP